MILFLILFQDLTGGVPQTIEIDTEEGKELLSSDRLWFKLKRWSEKGYLLGSTLIVEGGAVTDNR